MNPLSPKDTGLKAALCLIIVLLCKYLLLFSAASAAIASCLGLIGLVSSILLVNFVLITILLLLKVELY